MLSTLIIELRIFDRIHLFLNRPASFLFALDGKCLGTILLSMIGGLPLGCKMTSEKLREVKAQIRKEELQKTINKYGALVNNPVIKVVPNFIKQPVMRKMQKKTHAGVSTIFTNYGACTLPESLKNDVEKLQFVNGDTRSYGLAVTCSCIGFDDILSLCFSRANRDTVWYDACIKILNEQGIETRAFSEEGKCNGVSYPVKEREKLSAEKIKALFSL